MQVFETFRSIQGEGTRAGLAMWIVRLAGCDLACAYCDTPAARDAAAGRAASVESLVEEIDAAPLPWVLITGGEPLLQAAEVNRLADALIGRGCAGHGPPGRGRAREVLVETSGAHPIDLLDPRCVRIVDLKTPGSGMADRTCWRNVDLLTERDEVKFVLTGRADYEWAKDVVRQHGLLDRATVLFGAAAPALEPRALAGWILEDRLPVRLNVQLHKVLGLP